MSNVIKVPGNLKIPKSKNGVRITERGWEDLKTGEVLVRINGLEKQVLDFFYQVKKETNKLLREYQEIFDVSGLTPATRAPGRPSSKNSESQPEEPKKEGSEAKFEEPSQEGPGDSSTSATDQTQPAGKVDEERAPKEPTKAPVRVSNAAKGVLRAAGYGPEVFDQLVGTSPDGSVNKADAQKFVESKKQ